MSENSTPAATGGALREAILNLPVAFPPDFENEFERDCYIAGHLAALHAAAGLAASAAIPEQQQAHPARMLTGRECADVWAMKLPRDSEAIALMRRFCEVNSIPLAAIQGGNPTEGRTAP